MNIKEHKEKGVKLKSARIDRINNLQFDDFKKGSSWTEKGVKLFLVELK